MFRDVPKCSMFLVLSTTKKTVFFHCDEKPCVACVVVFSVSFQARRESREGSGTEVTKTLVAGGRGREGKEKPAAEPRHFTKRP